MIDNIKNARIFDRLGVDTTRKVSGSLEQDGETLFLGDNGKYAPRYRFLTSITRTEFIVGDEIRIGTDHYKILESKKTSFEADGLDMLLIKL